MAKINDETAEYGKYLWQVLAAADVIPRSVQTCVTKKPRSTSHLTCRFPMSWPVLTHRLPRLVLSLTADPTLNPFKALPSQLNPARLHEIEMVSPHILQIENFSQNMLLCAVTRMEIHWLFATAQGIGMETLEWIAEAKKWCGILGMAHSWHWPVDEGVNSDQFPALEGQSLLSDTTLVPNDSNVLILHPRFSTQSPGLVTLPPPKYLEEDCTEGQCQILSRLSVM